MLASALLLSALAVASSQWTAGRCPSACACSLKPSPEFGAPLRTVDCASRGLRAFPEPGSIPSDAQLLDLADNRIRHLDPESRLWLPELLGLRLEGNRLHRLPGLSHSGLGFFEGLGALRQLSLAGNGLRRVGADAFTGLLRLESLDLARNKIDGIMDEAFEGLGSLETLSLAGNRLSYAQKSWWRQLSSLNSLDLSGNQLGLAPADSFAALRRLRTLSLANNRLFRLDAHAFFGLSALDSLDLSRNQLTEWPAAALKPLRDSLKSLKAGRNAFFRLPTDALANFGRLTDVSLGGLGRLRLVERGAFKNLKSLLILELHDCPYFGFLDPVAFVNCPELSHLLLHNNNLTALQPETTQSLPRLEEVSFYGNPLACDCNAAWLQAQLAQDNQKIVFQEAERMVCASPQRLRFQLFKGLPSDALPRHCAPRIVTLFDGVVARRLGEDVVLDCRAFGEPRPAISWIGPEGSLIVPGVYHPRRSVQDGNTLVLRHLKMEDAGKYTCLASSERGEATATAHLNVSSMAVELLPLATTATSASVTWRGEDRTSSGVFQLLYRRVGEDSRHRYAASLSPAMKTYTLHGLSPASEYELCLAFEDGQGVLSHISCVLVRTASLGLGEALERSSNVVVACGLGILCLAFVLLAAMALLLRRGSAARRYAYDNLGQVEAGTPVLKAKLPGLKGQERRVSTENVYSPLVASMVGAQAV